MIATHRQIPIIALAVLAMSGAACSLPCQLPRAERTRRRSIKAKLVQPRVVDPEVVG